MRSPVSLKPGMQEYDARERQVEEELSSVTTARVSGTGGAPHDTGRQPGAEPDQVPEEPHSLRRADGLHRERRVSISSRRSLGCQKCYKKRVTIL